MLQKTLRLGEQIHQQITVRTDDREVAIRVDEMEFIEFLSMSSIKALIEIIDFVSISNQGHELLQYYSRQSQASIQWKNVQLELHPSYLPTLQIIN